MGRCAATGGICGSAFYMPVSSTRAVGEVMASWALAWLAASAPLGEEALGEEAPRRAPAGWLLARARRRSDMETTLASPRTGVLSSSTSGDSTS